MVGDQTQGFMQTRESLYQLSYTARPSTNLCVDNGCMGLFIHVHMCMQVTEVNSRYLLLLCSTLFFFFFQTVSHWRQNCTIKLVGWPVSFKVHVSLPLQDGVYRHRAAPPFTWVQETQTQVIMLPQQTLYTNWATSPTPQAMFTRVSLSQVNYSGILFMFQ